MHREEGRFAGRRFAGSAFWIASRTILRCTPSFLATPRTVSTPSKYSRRIFSNSSTLAFQSNRQPLPAGGTRLEQSYRFVFYLVGQIKWPRVGQNSWPNAEISTTVVELMLDYEGACQNRRLNLSAPHSSRTDGVSIVEGCLKHQWPPKIRIRHAQVSSFFDRTPTGFCWETLSCQNEGSRVPARTGMGLALVGELSPTA
jgi:hypothetical protein